MARPGGTASRALLVAALAVALTLGATPGVGATSHGSGASVPDRPSVDQTIDRLTARTREHRQDRAAWTALGDAFMQKARETADASYYGRAEQAFERARALDASDVRCARRSGVGAERAARVREVDRVSQEGAGARSGERRRVRPARRRGAGARRLRPGRRALSADARPAPGHRGLQPDRASAVRHRRRTARRVAHGQGDQRRRPVRGEHRVVPGAARADAPGDRQPAGRRAHGRAGDQPGAEQLPCAVRAGASPGGTRELRGRHRLVSSRERDRPAARRGGRAWTALPGDRRPKERGAAVGARRDDRPIEQSQRRAGRRPAREVPGRPRPPARGIADDRGARVQAPAQRVRGRRARVELLQERALCRCPASDHQGAGPAHTGRQHLLSRRHDLRQARRPRRPPSATSAKPSA